LTPSLARHRLIVETRKGDTGVHITEEDIFNEDKKIKILKLSGPLTSGSDITAFGRSLIPFIASRKWHAFLIDMSEVKFISRLGRGMLISSFYAAMKHKSFVFICGLEEKAIGEEHFEELGKYITIFSDKKSALFHILKDKNLRSVQ